MIGIQLSNFKTLKCDITQIEYDSSAANFILQICNNAGKYGAGLSGALSKKWPIVGDSYLNWYNSNNKGTSGQLDMGHIQIVTIDNHLAVVNMIAQYGVRHYTNPKPIDYASLEMCLIRLYGLISQLAMRRDGKRRFKIWCPKIGTGLAGGDWNIIIPKVVHWFDRREFDLTFVEF